MSSRLLSDEERLAWLRLIRSETIGPVTFAELLEHFGTAEAALDAVPALAERGGRRIRILTRADAEHEIAAVEKIAGRLVALTEPSYPSWLRHVDGAPPLLAVRGDAACLTRPIIAIVGSPNASVAGRKFAMQIAAGLGEAGFVIASGLARGIDAAAHEASLQTGTVAVLAGGLDQIYPPENLDLADRILAAGGVHLTEMPMGLTPRGKDFPRRNRIISGLAVAVVVVEAALRSGSLITARRAADQGRLVFAVPGSPLDPRAAGANLLLKEGARLVTSVDDVLSEIAPMLAQPRQPATRIGEPSREPDQPPDAAGEERTRIIEALGPTPIPVDELIRFTGLRPAIVQLVLLELSLAGRIERHPGGRISLIQP